MGRWLSDGWLGNVFAPLIKVQGGGGVGTLVVGGVANVQSGLATNVSTTATNLYTYTLPANAFNKNGQWLRMTAWGTYAGAAGTTVSATAFLGTTAIVIVTSTTGATNWYTNITMLRNGASTQECSLFASNGGNARPVQVTTAVEPDTAAINLRISGVSIGGGANGNVSGRGFVVEFGPA